MILPYDLFQSAPRENGDLLLSLIRLELEGLRPHVDLVRGVSRRRLLFLFAALRPGGDRKRNNISGKVGCDARDPALLDGGDRARVHAARSDDLAGDEVLGVLLEHHRAGVDLNTVGGQAAVGILPAPCAEKLDEPPRDRTEIIGGRAAVADGQAHVGDDFCELLAHVVNLGHGAGVEIAGLAELLLVLGTLVGVKQLEVGDKVSRVVTVAMMGSAGGNLLALGEEKRGVGGQKCRRRHRLLYHVGEGADRGNDHARQPWKQRELRHHPADLGEGVVRRECIEEIECLDGADDAASPGG